MARRALVTGATGQLGAYLVRELVARGREVVAWGHSCPEAVFGTPAPPVDLMAPAALASAFREARPDVVIHAAAMAAVSDCARDPARAEAVNTWATGTLADLCDAAGARLVFVSTDLVFDGERAPYREGDPPAPLSVYGRTKAIAERAVLESAGHAVVRLSLMFGPSINGRPNFFDDQVAALRAGQPVRLFHDEWRTPIGLATAARVLIEIADADVTGLLHVGGPERMSRVELGERLARHLGIVTAGIEAVSRLSAAGESRPRDTSLDSRRWRGLFPGTVWPGVEEALAEMGAG
jgi:dTDP-4-dehydrorhamnose reductase